MHGHGYEACFEGGRKQEGWESLTLRLVLYNVQHAIRVYSARLTGSD